MNEPEYWRATMCLLPYTNVELSSILPDALPSRARLCASIQALHDPDGFVFGAPMSTLTGDADREISSDG